MLQMIISIWVRSRNCRCLYAWFCYLLIAKPGNKTAAVPWPDRYWDQIKWPTFYRQHLLMYFPGIKFILWLKFHWSLFLDMLFVTSGGSLTHLPLNKMAAITQTLFSDAFSWMKSLNFDSNFTEVCHYLNQCWPDSLTHICGTRGRWVNSLTPGRFEQNFK